MRSGCSNIFCMSMIQLNGKSTPQMAEEYGVTTGRIRQYAREHDLPYISFDGGKTVATYIFDKEAELAFANRPKESPGAPRKPKPPKVPGKPGRPRKYPVDAAPKQPAKKPKKPPKESLGTGKRPRGRPRKS